MSTPTPRRRFNHSTVRKAAIRRDRRIAQAGAQHGYTRPDGVYVAGTLIGAYRRMRAGTAHDSIRVRPGTTRTDIRARFRAHAVVEHVAA